MTLFPIGHLTEISLFADVLSIIIIAHAIVFLKTFLVTQTCVLEISYNFRPFAFIENFQHPFPEASVEIITEVTSRN